MCLLSSWQPEQGGLGPLSLPPRQVVPWGGLIIGLGARVETYEAPAARAGQYGPHEESEETAGLAGCETQA